MAGLRCVFAWLLISAFWGCVESPILPGDGVLRTCERDADCATLGAGARCERGLCAVWQTTVEPKDGTQTEGSLDTRQESHSDIFLEQPSESQGPLESREPTEDIVGDAAPEEIEPEDPCVGGKLFCGGNCVDAQLDLQHCGQCDNPCASGQSCVQGLCVCPDGKKLCGEACVELQSDAAHCGDCDNPCAVGKICETGLCLVPCAQGEKRCGVSCVKIGDVQNCGRCGDVCDTGKICLNETCICPGDTKDCGKGCVDTKQDSTHCGGCGIACPSGKVCVSGSCTDACSVGQTRCGDQCTDISEDAKNCGNCGAACTGGKICGKATCQCPTARLDCAGTCVDTQTNASHCGACGQACGMGAICSAGACVCSNSNLTYCSGQCVFLMNEEAHCGACGQACKTGEVCWGGACLVAPYVLTHVGAVPGNTASFLGFPCGMARDANNNILIADFNKHQIFSVDSQRQPRLLAGSTAGFKDDNVAIQSQFLNPCGLTVHPSGDIYIADINNHRIRLLSTSGGVRTFAGAGPGFKDAIGANAKFEQPHDIVFDSTTSAFYVADFLNFCIRKVTLAGAVTVFAGKCDTPGYSNGVAGAARFRRPVGLALDDLGNLYVSDATDHRIRKVVLSSREVTTVAGSGVLGLKDDQALSAQFNSPRGIAWYNGALYIADRMNHRVRKWDPATGRVTTFAGTSLGYTNGPASSAKFYEPVRLLWGTIGDLFVADARNKAIRRIITR
ncbi:MAG: hypothetical protein H6728_11505 [Myxococcales bacterium]|nr:hypothetical protein [Myxococcales bacterium]